MPFRKKSESELEQLSDDELVDYVVAARRAGDADEMRAGLAFLSWGRRDQIFAWIRLKVSNVDDADELVSDVLEAAIKARFKGEHTGEFVNMLKKITQFKIADYHEAMSRKREREKAMVTADDGSDPVEALSDVIDGFGVAELEMVIAGVLEEEAPRTKMVTELKLDGHPAKEVAKSVTDAFPEENEMTSSNVDKIFSRFRQKLGAALREGDPA